MLQGQIPYGEGFELSITGSDAASILLIELAETHSHFSAAGSGSRNDDEGAFGLNIIVASKAFFGVNECHIIGVAIDGIMDPGAYAHASEAFTIERGALLTIVMGDDNACHPEVAIDKLFAQA